MGFGPACVNARDGGVRTAAPRAIDYPILLRGSKGPIVELSPPALLARACRQQWVDACRIATGPQPEFSGERLSERSKPAGFPRH